MAMFGNTKKVPAGWEPFEYLFLVRRAKRSVDPDPNQVLEKIRTLDKRFRHINPYNIIFPSMWDNDFYPDFLYCVCLEALGQSMYILLDPGKYEKLMADPGLPAEELGGHNWIGSVNHAPSIMLSWMTKYIYRPNKEATPLLLDEHYCADLSRFFLPLDLKLQRPWVGNLMDESTEIIPSPWDNLALIYFKGYRPLEPEKSA